jgi:hypothetical protein
MQVSPYEVHENQMGVRLSYLISDPDRRHPYSLGLMSYDAYKQRASRTPGFRLKEGRGKGNEVLVAWKALPVEWQSVCREKLGNPEADYNPLLRFFEISPEAKVFFDTYQFDNSEYLTAKQRAQYTINASVMLALIKLRIYRQAQRKSRGGTTRGMWDALAADVVNFQDHLKQMGHVTHTLPSSVKRLKMRYEAFHQFSFESFIDGRNNNSNAQLVTPQMIEIWQSIFAGQPRRKPTYIEVSLRYKAFLEGTLDIVNNATGEMFNPEAEYYKPASESTVYSYQAAWAQRAASHALRSGDRQKFKSAYEPWHKLEQPKFAGSIISIDDRQPPFEYAPGKRMWFYNAIDLGSEAFTCWVWGETKEGIIVEFYREMVRLYHLWGMNLPYEMECEMSLNSMFQDNLLQNGAMFQRVRIEANNARGKRIEAHYRSLRYDYEKDEEGWLARPFALSERNQKGSQKVPMLSKDQIVETALRNIQKWNNTLHSNQELHPGMTRWEVFMAKQHPELKPTNWLGILPYIGYQQRTSMHLGRIKLQGKDRVVGFDGEVATGEKLIGILKRIEGKEVRVNWLDDTEGQMLKAHVYDLEGNLICELLGDLGYSRSTLERTPEDDRNRELMSAYTATVQGYIKRMSRSIETVTLIEKPKPQKAGFVMPGLKQYRSEPTEAEILAPVEPQAEATYSKKFNHSTKSRF